MFDGFRKICLAVVARDDYRYQWKSVFEDVGVRATWVSFTGSHMDCIGVMTSVFQGNDPAKRLAFLFGNKEQGGASPGLLDPGTHLRTWGTPTELW